MSYLKMFFAVFLTNSAVLMSYGQSMPDSSVKGFYAWGETPHGILKVSLKRFKDPEYKKKFWEEQKVLHDSGKRKFMILELIFDNTLPKTRLPSPKNAEEEINLFFKESPGVMTYPDVVYAIVLSEEHTGKDIPVLNHIYSYVKKHWNVPVFQWLSEPLEPTHALLADGWIFDAYSIPNDAFYRHCQKFILTGKPVFPVLWAAEPGMDGYYKDGIEAMKKDAEQAVACCKSLNLPIFLFAVCRQHGSVGCWMSNKAPFPEIRAFFDGLIALPTTESVIPHPGNEFSIPKNGTYVWAQDFSAFSFVNYALLRNPAAMKITKNGLEFLQNSKKTPGIEWKFSAQDQLTEAFLVFTFTGKTLEVGYSFDGKIWRDQRLRDGEKVSFPLTGKQSFYFRVQGEDVLLKKMELQVKGIPNPLKHVTLSNDADGKYRLTEKMEQNRFLETIQTDSEPEQLLIRKGSIGILGKKGYPNQWRATQKLVFSKNTVKKIRLNVLCSADAKNWNCSVEAGISADGKNVLMKKTEPAKRRQTLNLELDVPEGASHCFLHFTLTNGSGVSRPDIAPGVLFGYELEAQ